MKTYHQDQLRGGICAEISSENIEISLCKNNGKIDKRVNESSGYYAAGILAI